MKGSVAATGGWVTGADETGNALPRVEVVIIVVVGSGERGMNEGVSGVPLVQDIAAGRDCEVETPLGTITIACRGLSGGSGSTSTVGLEVLSTLVFFGSGCGSEVWAVPGCRLAAGVEPAPCGTVGIGGDGNTVDVASVLAFLCTSVSSEGSMLCLVAGFWAPAIWSTRGQQQTLITCLNCALHMINLHWNCIRNVPLCHCPKGVLFSNHLSKYAE